MAYRTRINYTAVQKADVQATTKQIHAAKTALRPGFMQLPGLNGAVAIAGSLLCWPRGLPTLPAIALN